MATPTSAATAPQREWPESDLERADACPACASDKRRPLHAGLTDRILDTPGRWKLWRCGHCRSAYLDPRPTPATIGRAYGTGYMTHEPPLEPARGGIRQRLLHGYLNARYGYELPGGLAVGAAVVTLLPDAPARTQRVIRDLRYPHAKPTLLDVGCGNGTFLVQMRALGWETEGIDTDADALQHARAAGLRVQLATTADFTPSRVYDAITLGHVIEHFHDPVAELRRIHTLLAPGGRLWIGTPNIEAFGYRVFDADWFALDPPRHLTLFSQHGLELALRKAGFRSVERRLPPASAASSFTPSLAIRHGDDPLSARGGLPPTLRARRLAADVTSRIAPRGAEELNLVACNDD